ncbi:MAG: long-chain fatty acid--CoA ligase [Chitinivorax sp.]
MLIADWLAFWRRCEPQRQAVFDVAQQRVYSYAQLADAAEQFALQLQAMDLPQGARIALLAANCPQTLMLLFACARLGLVLVPLNYRLSPAELATIVADADPSLLLHDDVYQTLASAISLPELCRPLSLDDFSRLPQACCLPDCLPDAELPLVIQYTSGTTGQPKGVMQSQRMIGWNAINTAVSWKLSADDCALVHTPFFHTGGLHVLTTPLLRIGGRLVLLPAFDASTAVRLIDAQRVTALFAVPTMFQMMLDAPEFANARLDSLRFCVSGGAPCPVALIQSYQTRGLTFKQGYGLTEAGPNCLTLHPPLAVSKAGSVGVPNMHTEVRIVDGDGVPAKVGAVGELQLAGATLCSGYWRNASATAQLFDGKWLKTGDLVRVDEDGCFYIVDRKKDMYISGGENVYPAEVEAVLLQHPAVLEVAVVGVSDARWGEVGRAYLRLREGAELDERALQAFLASRLARYKWPKSLVVIDDPLPRTPTGKVQKNRLRS